MTGLVARFFAEGNSISLADMPPDLRDVIDPWAERAERGDGGLAFLPRGQEGRLWWYGFVPDPRSRRELLGFLDAWIGPTSSDLTRSRGRLDPSDPFDAAIAEERQGTVLRFEVLPRQGADAKQAKLEVRNALRRMVRLLDERPPSEFQAARSVAEVLEDLGHALSTREHGLAMTLLEELRTGGDLDETNLAFLRLRVHAGLALWNDVLSDPALPDVLEMRRPAGVSRAIQQAVYGAHLAGLDGEERDEALLETLDGVRERYAGLERGSPPPRSRAELVVQFLFALEAEPRIRAGLVDRLLAEADEIEIGLQQRLQRLRGVAEAEPPPVPPPAEDPFTEAMTRFLGGDAVGALEMATQLDAGLPAARLAVLAAADIGTPEAARRATAVVERDPQYREQIVASGALGRDSLERLDALTAAGAPDSWAAWFARLDGGAARDEAVAWARDDAEGWPPLDGEDAVSRVVDSADVVLEVLGEVSGLFLSAHSDLLDGPDRGALAERLIAALAGSGRTSSGVQAQALNLIDILLSSDPTAEQITTALEWLGLLRTSMAAAGTVDWQVDLLQTVTYYPVSDTAAVARTDYVNGSLGDLRPFRTALDRTTLESVAGACESVGLPLPPDFEHLRTSGTTSEADAYGCLADQRVVLYSLMESSARRAADTLRRLVQTVDVVTTADHVGSDRLADLSKNADVFVMVTAAAKHAATEFIEDHRKPRPVIHVHSKGTSALLRSLGEFCG